MTIDTAARETANLEAFTRMVSSDPVLVDVAPAGEVIPGMKPNTVLTSGPPHRWDEYVGPQRMALIYGAIHEGLAVDEADAEARFASGEIEIEPCHHHGAVGSVAGIYTASMPVFVVENRDRNNLAFCNFYEGESHRRLNYGTYGADVKARLDFIDFLRQLEVGAEFTQNVGKTAAQVVGVVLVDRGRHLVGVGHHELDFLADRETHLIDDGRVERIGQRDPHHRVVEADRQA